MTKTVLVRVANSVVRDDIVVTSLMVIVDVIVASFCRFDSSRTSLELAMDRGCAVVEGRCDEPPVVGAVRLAGATVDVKVTMLVVKTPAGCMKVRVWVKVVITRDVVVPKAVSVRITVMVEKTVGTAAACLGSIPASPTEAGRIFFPFLPICMFLTAIRLPFIVDSMMLGSETS